ncbi:class I tRNA ligase family protein, partial [Chloroflexota bacterium]
MTTEATAAASFTQTEEEIRRFWQRNDVLQAARAAHGEGRPFVIRQEPLSVLGPPWIDQVRLLSTTDLFTRYHCMRGKTVQCETGWACHGLELEVAVERSLGPALADCDITEFNAICHDTAVRGTRLAEGQAERLGVWFQSEHAFSSLTSESIGTVWRILNLLWDEGRLRSQQRVGAYCTRCATHLSAGEASQSSVESEASPVWVRLPWDGKPDAYFLARASAPWMLMGMVALAAHPDANYLLVEAGEGPARQDLVATRLLVSEEAAARSLPDGFRTVQKLRGQELRDSRFRPLFTFLPDAAATGRIVLSRSVPVEEGTGLMPVTPAFEGLSLELAQAHSLPVPELLDEWGSLDEMVASWRGLSPLDAEPLLVDDLRARGLVVREATMKRPQAICPYCDTPLLQLARPVWLAGDGDSQWVVDRSRPWGTPLPIWVCSDCAEQICVAGLDELGHLTGLELEQGDLHRPAIDRLTFACKSCDGLMRRVTPVVDTSFELAVLSATAQAGPADLAISLDRGDRGWLQDKDQLGTILQQAVADRPAIALPRKVVGRSWDHTRSSSGDALRWATYTETAPHLAEAGFLRQVQHLVQDLLAEPV